MCGSIIQNDNCEYWSDGAVWTGSCRKWKNQWKRWKTKIQCWICSFWCFWKPHSPDSCCFVAVFKLSAGFMGWHSSLFTLLSLNTKNMKVTTDNVIKGRTSTFSFLFVIQTILDSHFSALHGSPDLPMRTIWHFFVSKWNFFFKH